MRGEKGRHVYPPILMRARELRHPMTPQEWMVWKGVRNGQMGFKIRRQHPIARFIADFCCADAKLIVEIDGEIHRRAEQMEYDAVRSEWLAEHGYRVIRFTNGEVARNLAGVLETIRAACEGGIR